jgi:hypothetical protein
MERPRGNAKRARFDFAGVVHADPAHIDSK